MSQHLGTMKKAELNVILSFEFAPNVNVSSVAC